MNKFLTTIAAVAIAAFTPIVMAPHAKAQVGVGIGSAGSSSQSQAGAIAQSNSGIVFNSPSHVTTRGRIVQTVPGIGPSLAASAVNTCLGSVSAGVGVTGLGLSFGSTYLENHCEARMTGTLLNQMGAKNAGLLAMCANPIAYDALAASGVRCPFGRGNHYAGSGAAAPVAQPAPIVMTQSQYRAYQRQQAAGGVVATQVVTASAGSSRAEQERAAAVGAKTALYNQCVAQAGQNCASFR